ncbi:cyclopropane-fatty-acyl-phospholipid synthase family protein [uncultured Roseibium sp.]|uniref:cyclopropane-fatty-acyl-phospholipid synthase family protein n=1 Tax=uncultured Roseibium sp. TaxID=1936171 RepID=UPI003217C3A0
MRMLASLLKSCIKRGRLRIVDANGKQHEFGSGYDGPEVFIRFHDPKLHWKLVLHPELAAAEAYMDGTLTLEEGSTCLDFIDLFFVNPAPEGLYPLQEQIARIGNKLHRFHEKSLVSKTKRHVQHHYDLSTELYRLFLDEGLNYSCAYYQSPKDSLEKAQAAKLDHLIAKLDIEPGMRVLEIGGGWGSLAMHMGRAGADVTSLNVSGEQIAIAEQRVAAAGLEKNVRFVKQDYREFTGKFDRIVSVGMMEHVGVGNYDGYFGKVRDCLKPDGYAVIHSIGRMAPPGTTGPFILKYIFPGGYCPALSEVMQSIERLGLWVCDTEILRLHYYYTLKAWRERFEANWDKAAELYDERFCRMWEFYLCACEVSFLHGNNMVFQLMLSLERDAVPIVRDFIVDNEKDLREKASKIRKTA